MLTLTFSESAYIRTRFAFSVLHEVIASVLVLVEPARHALHLPWIKEVRRRLPELGGDLTLLAALFSGPRPGFLAPRPTTPMPALADELASLTATPADQVRADVECLSLSPAVAELFRGEPERAVRRVATAIEAYWSVALAEHWPRLCGLLEADVVYRARRLAEGGAHRLFNDLAPEVRWQNDTLYVADKHHYGSRALGGEGLLLVPSVFAWPRVSCAARGTGSPTLTYPSRGVATLWERGAAGGLDALAAVIGRSRAQLLSRLDSPASTSELSQLTGLSAGGVSQHLTVLRSAGLVTAYRSGRSVLYFRTTIAESLFAGADD